MLKLPPGPKVEALQNKSNGDDKKKGNSQSPPKHARLTFAQTIAETADGFDSVAGLAQFFAQPANVSIDGSGINHAFITPDVAKKAIPFLHPAAPLNKSAQQFVFETGEMNDFAVDGNMMAQAIDADRAGDKRFRFARGLAAAQNGLGAQHDFARRERFRNIVVRSQLETDNAIDFLRLGCKHENGNVPGEGVTLKNFADLQARHFRQHQIENDQDRRFFARPTQTGRAVRGGDDIESGGAFKSANQYFDNVGFVFDDENFLFRGRAHDHQF